MTTERAESSLLGDRYDQRKDASLTESKPPILLAMSRVTTSSSHFESGLARETRDSYGMAIRKAN
ncbi:hypothetical protein JG635_09305 [Vibrio cholerae]|uniref:hypothetical protein n=1 Tax=Vibrio cholerae TaxID=666 RepID=UPI0018F06EC0|nr:hypothetical protein [Vibrio cholerae]MBJ6971798.1 hypothetical protein [Vibrio cholerae]